MAKSFSTSLSEFVGLAFRLLEAKEVLDQEMRHRGNADARVKAGYGAEAEKKAATLATIVERVGRRIDGLESQIQTAGGEVRDTAVAPAHTVAGVAGIDWMTGILCKTDEVVDCFCWLRTGRIPRLSQQDIPGVLGWLADRQREAAHLEALKAAAADAGGKATGGEPVEKMSRAAAHKLALAYVKEHGWPSSIRKLAESVDVSRPLLDDLPGIEQCRPVKSPMAESRVTDESPDSASDNDPSTTLAYAEERARVRGILDDRQRQNFDRLSDEVQKSIVEKWDDATLAQRTELLELCSEQAGDAAEGARPRYVQRRTRV
jgi:hypothetical protein